MRLWPKSILGQFLTLLVVVVLLLQAATLIVLTLQHRDVIRRAAYGLIAERTTAIYNLLEETPRHLQNQILSAANTKWAWYTVTADPTVSTGQTDNRATGVVDLMRSRLGPNTDIRVWIEADDRDAAKPDKDEPDWRRPRRQRSFKHDDDDDDHHTRPWRRRAAERATWRNWRNRALRGARRWALSIELPDKRWLNLTGRTEPPGLLAGPMMISLIAVIVVALLAGYFLTRRITGPLRGLRSAAERLGRGETVAPLAEKGPQDIRKVIGTFNDMQARLTRFVGDRTRMLAAISHDLRTPVTTLRLRAEFIEDSENREKILQTLDEMQAMIESTLSFAREDAANEETEAVDLASLLQSHAADMTELGSDVTYSGPDRHTYPCRHHALLRAVRNLTENAVRYGKRATVHLSAEAGGPKIIVEDDGPGIPEDRMADVFEPFVRVEGSRNAETGGIGLGLAIARTIVQAHGGEIHLANRAEGGLRAVIELPPVD